MNKSKQGQSCGESEPSHTASEKVKHGGDVGNSPVVPKNFDSSNQAATVQPDIFTANR